MTAIGAGEVAKRGNAVETLADVTESDDESWRKKNEIFNATPARVS
jgi:hypothetical protein